MDCEVRAGILTEIIKIQKPTVAVDGYGANDIKWHDYITTRANVTYQNGNRVNDTNEVTFAYQVSFTVRLYHDIDERMRIIYRNKKYRILSIEESRQIQKLTIRAELINE